MTSEVIFALFLSLLLQANSIQIDNGDVSLDIDLDQDGEPSLNLTLAGEEKISGRIGIGGNLEVVACNSDEKCVLQTNNATLTIDKIDNGFSLSWVSNNTDIVLQDCLNLKTGEVNWFGGSEKLSPNWPLEKSKFVNRPFISIKTDFGAVAERYWLNSKGGYIFLDERVPLFLDQNNLQDDGICFVGKVEDPYFDRSEVVLEYVLVAGENAKESHLHAVNNYLGKAPGHPDEWIVRNPIWTTWAKYKKSITDATVVDFASAIAAKGFAGQIEIDDYWETCYGSLTFNEQFPDINNTVQTLKDLGFTVSLWTHPFVNHNCNETMTYGMDNDFFVKSVDGNIETSWWDGNPAHFIDFTNENATNWYVERLQRLQDLHGIDSFKFDAGESDYTPQNPVLSSGDAELNPGLFTTEYIKTCASFGGLIEVRTAWRNQNLPVFVRILDKASRWDNNNGLASLIISLLQFNIIGYPFVLPDMIGGNGYGDELPTAELIARWTQANTFMPSMQFSYLPWDITSDEFNGEEIIKKFVNLHSEYADDILAAMDNNIKTGTPVNPPIWWVDPTNGDAFKISDEYLLGESILVAPVIQEGAVSRDVFLPSGSWKDGNNGTIYEGPQTVKDYSAPIDVLPFFIKQ